MGKKDKKGKKGKGDESDDDFVEDDTSEVTEGMAKTKLSNKEKRALKKKAIAVDLDEQVKDITNDLIGPEYICSCPTAGKAFAGSIKSGIDIGNFSIRVLRKQLFKDSKLHLEQGHRYGLVGPNGSGKSSLLKHLAARVLPLPENQRVLYVEQEAESTDVPALKWLLDSETEVAAFVAEQETLENQLDELDGSSDAWMAILERLVQVYDELAARDVDMLESRAKTILAGLQFTEQDLEKPTSSFSGGWRMRLSLARALLLRPWLLLLDEPTNHLDLNAAIWLADYMQSWQRLMVVVSHDQSFLNHVCTDTLHVYQEKLNSYDCPFDDFLDKEEKARALQQKSFTKQVKEERASKQSDNKGGKGKGGGKGGGKGPRKGQMDDDEDGPERIVAPKEYVVHFSFPPLPREFSPPLVELDGVSFSYPGKPLFSNLTWDIGPKQRVAIVGLNGAGKSTLLRLLCGNLEPSKGKVIVHHGHMRIGRYAQHFVDQLDNLGDNPVEHLQKIFPTKKPADIHKTLGLHGLSGTLHSQSMRSLSGGQKARVMFAELFLSEPHLLVLDEPTNHLDIESVQAMAEALNEFEGASVVVTHDARLIVDTQCELWRCANETLEKVEGGYPAYHAEVLQELKESEALVRKAAEAAAVVKAQAREDRKRQLAERRAAK